MISEKKINYYLHFADNSCNKECQKIITQLVDEVHKLEELRNRKTIKINELIAVIDWLAYNCETLSGYNPILRQGMTKTQWRVAAYKAVQDEHK